MCECPVTISNPAYRGGASSHYRHTDDISPTIVVPCGHCSQCASNKSIYLAQRLEVESLAHWIFFFTFTCKDEYLIREDFNGTVLSRFPVDVLTKVLKRFRHQFDNTLLYNRSFKYYFLNEYGSSFHRPHIHGFFLIGKDDDTSPTLVERFLYKWWKENLAVNIGSYKKPVYESIFDFKQCYRGGKLLRNYDLRYVDIKSPQNFGPLYYINKYLFKSDDFVQYMWNVIYDYYGQPKQVEDEETYHNFIVHWNLYKPRVRKSLYFGFPFNYIDFDFVNGMAQKSLDRGLPSPSFISPINDSSKPLSPYYKQYVSPRLLDKFKEAEFAEKGFITQKNDIPAKKLKFSPNLFDFTDLL